jgi:hypothetical protein
LTLGRSTPSSRPYSYLQRAPWPIGARTTAKSGTNQIPDLRETATFKRLDADTVAFRLSFPRELRQLLKREMPAGGFGPSPHLPDIHLILAHMVRSAVAVATGWIADCALVQVAHTATIVLHESFCSVEPGDTSMTRCSSSARAILAYLLVDSAVDLALLQPFVVHCWSIGGRTLIRELAIANHHGDGNASAMATAMVTRVIEELAAKSRTKLPFHAMITLKGLLANSASCLPNFGRPSAYSKTDQAGELFDASRPRPDPAYINGQPIRTVPGTGTFLGSTTKGSEAPFCAPPAAPGRRPSESTTTSTPSLSNGAPTPSVESAPDYTSAFLLECVVLTLSGSAISELTCRTASRKAERGRCRPTRSASCWRPTSPRRGRCSPNFRPARRRGPD